MANLIWWIQLVGGALSAIIMAGVILSGLYAGVNGAPKFMTKVIGLNGIDSKLDTIIEDQRATQVILISEAEAINDLSETVREFHDIDSSNSPDPMDIDAVRHGLSKSETLPDDYRGN